MTSDSEEALEQEFRALFKRIKALGYREGERAALNRIIGLAQAALTEPEPKAEPKPEPRPEANAAPAPAAETAEHPMSAQRVPPLRRF